MAFQPTRQLGFQLLAVWLIAGAVIQLAGIGLAGLGFILPPLAFLAGLLILIGKAHAGAAWPQAENAFSPCLRSQGHERARGFRARHSARPPPRPRGEDGCPGVSLSRSREGQRNDGHGSGAELLGLGRLAHARPALLRERARAS